MSDCHSPPARHVGSRPRDTAAASPSCTPPGRSMTRVLLATLLVGAATLSACERKPPQPETSAQPTASTEALPGVKPHDEGSAPASDRPGAVAIGAVEAGQSGGGANGAHPAPTAGDGAASGAASAPAR